MRTIVFRKSLSLVVSSADISVNLIPTPKPGRLFDTMPSATTLSSFSQTEIFRRVPMGNGIIISAKQPPWLISPALVHVGGCPLGRSSTDAEHFTRG